jgi:hypothetical protein
MSGTVWVILTDQFFTEDIVHGRFQRANSLTA